MKSALRTVFFRITQASAVLVPLLLIGVASAQVFTGPGLQGGIDKAKQINTGGQGKELSVIVTLILIKVLSFLALVAVIAIVVAGIYLIASSGLPTTQ